ncbi:PREDICTED: formin-like protein 20 [Tarenaya hassleriana]|uniref:formin-like protein 20 n=1 Tax=Tarenaya hassleriana TaxID=28532 RepID=UPI00053C6A44|nr:PREDICTED: formin-like protein 20 [Tarenaya hassleriana]
MAAKQVGGDGSLPANLAGMTKSQLYDIMSQMKALIDQNQQQAREILIQNPVLTKALFQAQIMLGMVQPPQVIPKIEPQASQQPQQSHQAVPPKSNIQTPISSVQGGLQEPIVTTQPQAPLRKHPMPQPMPMPPSSVPATNKPSQRQQHFNPAVTLPPPQSSQVQSAPPASIHSTSQPPPFHHLDIPASSTQLQQPMHSGGVPHLPPQQPLPPQPRPSSMPSYHHQFGPAQTGPNVGFQHHGAPPQHLSQPIFHSGARPAGSRPQFPHGQPHLPSQPPYHGGGPPFGGEYNDKAGGPIAAERGSSWMPGQSEGSIMNQLPGAVSVPPPGLIGQGGVPPAQPAPLTAEMEKALLQQVMSLTQEQINLLPPEQRNQVFQLQQLLRH